MQLSPAGYDLLAGCILFLIIFGCFIQSVTLVILLKKENQTKCLTPYLLNIVAANALMILGSFPTTVASALNHGWMFNDAVCKLVGFIGGCAAIAMIATMLCITITIHHTVVKQSVTNHVLHQPPDRTQLKVILAVWIYSGLSMIPPVVGFTDMKKEAANTNCAPDWAPKSTGGVAYIVVLTVVAYIIPVGGSLLFYLKIQRALKKHMSLVIPVITIQNQLRRFQNITKMSAMAILAFTVTWFPYACYVMISAFGGTDLFTAVSSVVPCMVAKTSILYNPFVYALVNPRFRRSVLEMFGFFKPSPRKNVVGNQSFTSGRSKSRRFRNRLVPRKAVEYTMDSTGGTLPRFLKSKKVSDAVELATTSSGNCSNSQSCSPTRSRSQSQI